MCGQLRWVSAVFGAVACTNDAGAAPASSQFLSTRWSFRPAASTVESDTSLGRLGHVPNSPFVSRIVGGTHPRRFGVLATISGQFDAITNRCIPDVGASRPTGKRGRFESRMQPFLPRSAVLTWNSCHMTSEISRLAARAQKFLLIGLSASDYFLRGSTTGL